MDGDIFLKGIHDLFVLCDKDKGSLHLKNRCGWDSRASDVSIQSTVLNFLVYLFFVLNDHNGPLFMKSKAEIKGGKWSYVLFYENHQVS